MKLHMNIHKYTQWCDTLVHPHIVTLFCLLRWGINLLVECRSGCIFNVEDKKRKTEVFDEVKTKIPEPPAKPDAADGCLDKVFLKLKQKELGIPTPPSPPTHSRRRESREPSMMMPPAPPKDPRKDDDNVVKEKVKKKIDDMDL